MNQRRNGWRVQEGIQDYARDPRSNPRRSRAAAIVICNEVSGDARNNFRNLCHVERRVTSGVAKGKRLEIVVRTAALATSDRFATGRARVRP